MPQRLRAFAAGAVAALTIAVAALTSVPASAAPSTRVVPVAGTDHHLVYGSYSPPASGKATVRLYSIDDRGRTLPLGSIRTSTPTAIPATAAGSVLVAPKNGSASFRWDLTTGTRTTVPAGAVAAPGGYAAMGVNGRSGEDARQTVVLVTDAGTTELGTPFPHGENADGSFHLFSGSAGVVVTDGNGHVRFIAFGEPGKVRSLRTFRGGAATASLGCSGMTSASLACTAFDEETTTLMRIGLDRSGAVDATPDCVGAPAALRTAIAWVGCRNRLQVLRKDGSVRVSTVAFGSAHPVSAFGAVVLQSKDGRSLQSMTRAGSRPRTVVAAIR